MANDKRAEMEGILAKQREAFTADRPEQMSIRKDRISARLR